MKSSNKPRSKSVSTGATKKRHIDLTERICKGLEEVKEIISGKKPRRDIQDFLKEL